MTHGGEPALIGPGRLVLVIGPSGAGKDTLIRAARERLAGDRSYVFPRRVITRPPSDDEDNSAIDDASFTSIAAAGGFALSWEAHGLNYAVPASIHFTLAEGRTVICNVSRTVVATCRARYENVRVIEVTAPSEVLAARLAARGRPQDGSVAQRLARTNTVGRVEADVTVENTGAIEEACTAFIAAVTMDLVPHRDRAAAALS